jgi:hypothetical protein
MIPRKVILAFSGIAAAACLIFGMGPERWWLGLIVSGGLAGCLIYSRVRRIGWLPSACLAGYTLAGGAGLLTGGSALWLVYGAWAALINWDLVLYSWGTRDEPRDDFSRRCEREHLKAFGIAAAFGLALVTAGMGVHLHIPFALMLAAAAVALAGLLLTWWRLQKADRDQE